MRAYSIFTRTLERYTLLAMAKAHSVRSVFVARLRRDNAPSNRLVLRTTKMLAPLFQLDEEAKITMSPKMARRLEIAGLEHVGKHIPRMA